MGPACLGGRSKPSTSPAGCYQEHSQIHCRRSLTQHWQRGGCLGRPLRSTSLLPVGGFHLWVSQSVSAAIVLGESLSAGGLLLQGEGGRTTLSNTKVLDKAPDANQDRLLFRHWPPKNSTTQRPTTMAQKISMKDTTSPVTVAKAPKIVQVLRLRTKFSCPWYPPARSMICPPARTPKVGPVAATAAKQAKMRFRFKIGVTLYCAGQLAVSGDTQVPGPSMV
mmetsp:Transcript_141742/g.395197  ORF Transcript_141742/g.395197 Transcript_141742/m.395197 type:complete len:222 (-) Transcript_141742:1140-1805(-)